MESPDARFYFRWCGTARKGVIGIGAFKWELSRLPRGLTWFDIFFEPPVQMEVRERACDEKREMYDDERRLLVNYIKPIGALVRQIEDIVRG